MKKLFLIFSTLLFGSAHCRMNAVRSLAAVVSQRPAHAIIVRKAAKRIPYSALMQKLFQERTHAETVLRAAFLNPAQIVSKRYYLKNKIKHTLS